jgi:hypothetical protein
VTIEHFPLINTRGIPMHGRNTRPIIVGGCYRSGTSLVRRILNAHSRIQCGPEVKFFRDFYGDYFSDPVSHLRFTTSARSILTEEELLELLGQAFIRLHERAAANAGKYRWADKNPENVLYLSQWQRLLGDDWLFVHVARNPLDTLSSMLETPFPLTLPADMQGRAALFCRYNQAALDFAAAYPNRYYVILYEKLVSAPEQTLIELMGWLGEAFESRQLRFNDVSLQAGLEDPKIALSPSMQTQSLGRWRQMLTPEDAALIRRETESIWRAVVAAERHRER